MTKDTARTLGAFFWVAFLSALSAYAFELSWMQTFTVGAMIEFLAPQPKPDRRCRLG
jgi:hypothetical protein